MQNRIIDSLLLLLLILDGAIVVVHSKSNSNPPNTLLRYNPNNNRNLNTLSHMPFFVWQDLHHSRKSHTTAVNSAYYDTSTNSIYITGGSFTEKEEEEETQKNKQCFVLHFSLSNFQSIIDTYDTTNLPLGDSLLWSKEYKSEDGGTYDVCTDVTMIHHHNRNILSLAGYSTHPQKSQHNLPFMIGFTAEDDTESTTHNNDAILSRGYLHEDHAVQYPITLQTFSNGDLLVAMVVSHSAEEDENDLLLQRIPFFIPPFGNNFEIELQRLKPLKRQHENNGGGTVISGNGSHSLVWNRTISTTEKDRFCILTDVAIISNNDNSEEDEVVLMTGYTTGHSPSLGINTQKQDSDDIDGFITKLNGSNGAIPSSNTNKRINDKPGSIELIGGICHTSHHLYIVGSTTGLLQTDFDKKGKQNGDTVYTLFIKKLDIVTLKSVWTRQIGSNEGESVFGGGCVVDKKNDHKIVHVSGVVTNGDSILDQSSCGKDDIFYASIHTNDGTIKDARQTGSSSDETLSRRHSILLDTNTNNIVLIGTTFGNMIQRVGGEGGGAVQQEGRGGGDGANAKKKESVFILTSNPSYTPNDISFMDEDHYLSRDEGRSPIIYEAGSITETTRGEGNKYMTNHGSNAYYYDDEEEKKRKKGIIFLIVTGNLFLATMIFLVVHFVKTRYYSSSEIIARSCTI